MNFKKMDILLYVLIVLLSFFMYISITSFTENNITKASWYGPGFNGKITANGEIYNQDSLTCASPVLPFNTKIKITNIDNCKTIIVRVNDRGPYKMNKKGKAIFPLEPHPIRAFDLSKASFDSIANLDVGIIKIKYKIFD